MKKELLVTLSDDNFIEQAKQFFSSVYWNSGWKGDYMLLACDVSEEKLKWFTDKGILVYRCDPLSDREEVGVRNHPRTVLAKLYLFTTYFKQWKTVVFFDADIIVKASLDGLAHVDDFCAPNASGINLRKEFYCGDKEAWRDLKTSYRLTGKAFNTGVFAFNTELIQDDSFEKVCALFKKYEKVSRFGEEGVLNLFFYKKWSMLPVVYNQYPNYMHIAYGLELSDDKCIAVHFVGANKKPWKQDSPFYKEWSTNLSKANAINLSRRVEAVKVWSHKEIEERLAYLRKREVLFFGKRFIWFADRMLKKIKAAVKKRYANPLFWSLCFKRRLLGIQITGAQLLEIAETVKPPLNFLVFGLGNDSVLWHQLNKGGRTVFIEDQKEWFEAVKTKHSFLEACFVDYQTKREQWKDLIDSPEKLKLVLPKSILDTKWDVILVDAPAGNQDGKPGRMKSIYMASLMIKEGGDVFVHDVDREVEWRYSDKYLLRKNVVGEIKSRAILRHYVFHK